MAELPFWAVYLLLVGVALVHLVIGWIIGLAGRGQKRKRKR